MNDDIFRCERPCYGGWIHVPGKLMQVDAGDMEVWRVNKHHQIFKQPADSTGLWRGVGGILKHVSASGNGYIWGVNANDTIYKCKKPCNGAWVYIHER